jgi:3-oxoadipate enol-lactonase
MPYTSVSHDGRLDIWYADEGRGDPVVLIGGFTSTAEVWQSQLPALAEHFRVLRPDNRGSGRTRLLEDDGERPIARFAGDVLALLDALGLRRVHLCGASMGGMIVQEFAVRYPERLRSLVIACSHPGGALNVPADPTVAAEFGAGSVGGASEAARRRTLEIVFHPKKLEESAEIVAAYEAGKLEFPHAAEELVARSQGVAKFDVSERLSGLAVPTLVMCGDGDLIVPPENSRRITDTIPGAELVTIPDAGHLFFAQSPDACNRALVDFFSRH